MKVAFVSHPVGILSLPVQGGSLNIWTYELARRLVRSCEIVVYSARGPSQKNTEYHQGVCYRRVSAAWDDSLLRLLSPFSWLRDRHSPLFASWVYYLGYILQVARDLRRQGCDVVHLHNLSQFAGIVRRQLPQAKIVLHMHTDWLTQLDPARIARRLQQVDLVMGVSEHITGQIRRAFPQYAGRCRTLFNGVDLQHFSPNGHHDAAPKSQGKRVLFVGRLTPEKGLHVLLDAFQKVVERNPGVELEVIGPEWRTPLELQAERGDSAKMSQMAAFYRGSYLAQLQQRAQGCLAGRVTFRGFVPYGQLTRYYRAADVLVNPSLSESFGMSLTEAMACQLPVVATRVGGMREIVEDGKTGLLVEPGDASALAEVILRLLGDERLRKGMGQAARQRAVEFFSWERIAEDLLNEYNKLCARDG